MSPTTTKCVWFSSLERHTGRRPGRTHDGVVIALRWNIRWCSDHFELACRNGEIVRVLFAIDACDREVMGWLATSAGISGEMVRNLMVACVERREADGAIVFEHACALGCEGIVSKRLGSPYRAGRVDHWLKIKNPGAPAVRREAEEDWGGKLADRNAPSGVLVSGK